MGPNLVRPRESGPKEGTGNTSIPQGKRDMGWLGHGQQQMEMTQDKPKCCKLDTQRQILILQLKKAAEKVLGGGADLGWTVLGCASAQGSWDWWWQEAREV